MLHPQAVQHILGHTEDRVDRLDAGLPEQRETGHPEEGVKGVRHVPRTVSKPTRLRILQHNS